MLALTLLRFNEHGVAIREEAVALADRMAVGLEEALLAREGAYQHEQGGFRQVEIGEQPFYHLELEAGIDEKIRGALALAAEREALQRPQRGRAHGQRAALSQRFERFRRNGIALLVHAVRLDLVDAHRLEGAGADVQGDAGDARAARGD